MKNIFERILTAVIALPLLFALVYVFNGKNHLLLNIVITVFSALGTLEYAQMLRKKNMEIHNIEAIFLGTLPQAALVLHLSWGVPQFVFFAVTLACALYCLAASAFSRAENLEKAAFRLAAGFSALLYPGVFMGCFIMISSLPSAAVVLIVFLCTVIINDTAAWFFGNLFGKGSKGVVAASPNKSLVGFICGFAGSMAVCLLAPVLAPEIFAGSCLPPFVSAAILGLATGIAATVGDLAESSLKRSTGVKDSGRLMLGRGGILDSVDSIAFAAPVFYIVQKILVSRL